MNPDRETKETRIIIRYGELWLKGHNRSFFEHALIKNIRACLISCAHPHGEIIRKNGRIIIASPHLCEALTRVSGIVSYGLAVQTEATLEKIKHLLGEQVERIDEPFCIRVNRLEKHGPLSQEIERDLGAFIVQKTGKKVQLEKPKTTVRIDWYLHEAYVLFSEENGVGGLPIRPEGRVCLLLRTEKDVIAGKLLLKRGCLPDVIVNNQDLYRQLQHWCPGISLPKIDEESLKTYDFVVSGDENSPLPTSYLPLEGMEEGE